MVPTPADPAGASTAASKPQDGTHLWPVNASGAASPRRVTVRNAGPLTGAVRRGVWKMAGKAALPRAVGLSNPAVDPAKTQNPAAGLPDRVAVPRKRIVAPATETAPPLPPMEAARLTHYAPPVSGDPFVRSGRGG